MFVINSTTFLLLLILVAGLVHALVQAPLGFLLQMAGNSLGHANRKRALYLSLLMSLGMLLLVALLVIVASVVLQFLAGTPDLQRIVVGGLLVLSGLFVSFKYFRTGPGTALWLNRQFTRGLQKTVDEAKRSGAAFGVGMLGILIELPLTFPLLLAFGLLARDLSGANAAAALGLYSLAVVLPVFLTGLFLAHGKRIVAFQRQREHGKLFLQLLFGLSMIGLGAYILSGQFLMEVA